MYYVMNVMQVSFFHKGNELYAGPLKDQYQLPKG